MCCTYITTTQLCDVSSSKIVFSFSEKVTRETEEPSSNFKLNLPPPKNDSKEAQTSEMKSKLSLPLPKNNTDETDNYGDYSIKFDKNDDKEKVPIRDDKSPPKKVLKRRNRDVYATKEEEDE